MQARINRPQRSVELVSAALQELEQGHRVVLATLVNIEGNAPYPVGTQMLISEDGRFSGQITGGCAETAIVDQALHILAQGSNQTQRYGLDSPYFDIQLPCGSGIDVYFDCEVTLGEMQSVIDELSSRGLTTRRYLEFEKTYYPDTRLMLFGQGPIMVILAHLALQSEFEVICVAQNDETRKLLDRHGLMHQSLDANSELLQLSDEFTAIVSLFHEHDLEVPILRKALDTEAFYIGALGSKRTHAERVQKLQDSGVEDQELARIHGPVGLNIGANTPSQIAVSILAEVIAEKNRYVRS